MITFNGHDMSGPTANRPTNAEIGQPFFDTTLKQLLVWNGVAWQATKQAAPVTLTGSTDAISPHVSQDYAINTAGVDAMTLAAPTATTDDGVTLVLTSNTANAHTLTSTGLLQTGGTAVNEATFAAHPGASLTLKAYQGKWNVISQNGVTFS